MKKTTLKTRLWALAATLLLLVSLLALPVSAANKPVTGGTFNFDKYLVMDKNANVPNVSFTFSIAAGDAVSASGTDHVIYAGDDTNRVSGTPVLKVDGTATGTVTFAPTDITYTKPTNWRFCNFEWRAKICNKDDYRRFLRRDF